MASIVSQDQDIIVDIAKETSTKKSLFDLEKVKDKIFLINCATEAQWCRLEELLKKPDKKGSNLIRLGLGGSGWLNQANQRFTDPEFLIVYRRSNPLQKYTFLVSDNYVLSPRELQQKKLGGFPDDRMIYRTTGRAIFPNEDITHLLTYFEETTNWNDKRPLFLKGSELELKISREKSRRGRTPSASDEDSELARVLDEMLPHATYEDEALTSIDLFSGCGGLTKGFSMAGIKSVFATDIDTNCEKTFHRNFPDVPFLCKDIADISKTEVDSLIKGQVPDIIIGGPPCQGFSLANKRRNKVADDPRNRLFFGFVKFLDWYSPKVFVMENVKGILSMQGGAVLKTILEELQNAGNHGGYNVSVKVMLASDYGVPQNRERVIFLGYRKDLQIQPEFPRPTTPDAKVTVDDAIGDLPLINSSEGTPVQHYRTAPQNEYQSLMRAKSKYVLNHIAMRHTPRLIERFKAIRPGQSLVDVWETHGSVKRGAPNEKSDVKFGQNNQRLFGNEPAPTVAASFQSNFIHPHLNRNFTAREGARLQSFPDDFVFEGMRTKMSWEKGLSQYQQIGNAVPVLLAYAIANQIKETLSSVYEGINRDS